MAELSRRTDRAPRREAALGSRARPVVVVTGHARGAVEAALAGLPLRFRVQSGFRQRASRRRSGPASPRCRPTPRRRLVLLGDMPNVDAELIDRLIVAFRARPDALAVAPLQAGRRGNPVLLGPDAVRAGAARRRRRRAPASRRSGPGEIVEIDAAGSDVSFDVDTPDDLAAARPPRSPDLTKRPI